MIKLLILFGLFFFVFFRIGGYLLKSLFGSSSQQRQRNFNQRRASPKKWQPKDGNINVDYDPGKPGKRGKQDFNDGEYIDYEEVK